MRRILLVATLVLAGCTRDPVPPSQLPTPVQPSPQVQSDVLGLSAAEVLRRFGSPALQVREGPGLKMQWRGAACVLDAYLYPPVQGSGLARVVHVDSRYPNGAAASQPACIAALEAR